MSDLSDFLRKKKAQFKQKQVNWNQVKSDWIQQLNSFMKNIKSWLLQPQKEGLLTIVEKEIEITEEHFGTYKVPALELLIGSESIKITPIGYFIIGATGRVDITSFLSTFIVLHHSEKGWIYRNDMQKGSFQPFTEEHFTKIMKDLV